MKLLILAGGFGTRLREVVPFVPKAMAPINGIPFLSFQIENWIRQGVTSFVFLLHHQSEHLIDFIKSTPLLMRDKLDVQWIVEPKPLGTGGALVNAVSKLQIRGDFLVVNGDTWLDTGLKEVAGTGVPAIGVVKVANSGRYGNVIFNKQNKVSSFLEKNNLRSSGWINSGLCYLSASQFCHENIQPTSLEEHFFKHWVEKSLLKATQLNCNFIDIGIPSDYSRFCNWIQSGKSGML